MRNKGQRQFRRSQSDSLRIPVCLSHLGREKAYFTPDTSMTPCIPTGTPVHPSHPFQAFLSHANTGGLPNTRLRPLSVLGCLVLRPVVAELLAPELPMPRGLLLLNLASPWDLGPLLKSSQLDIMHRRCPGPRNGSTSWVTFHLIHK